MHEISHFTNYIVFHILIIFSLQANDMVMIMLLCELAFDFIPQCLVLALLLVTSVISFYFLCEKHTIFEVFYNFYLVLQSECCSRHCWSAQFVLVLVRCHHHSIFATKHTPSIHVNEWYNRRRNKSATV